jgi:nitroimidazol reductase NimA-like FMN-containing flavoprotein (pyridoxamine 5'-phosphate oxidase superfamily)
MMHVRSLSTLECTKLLSASRLAHLACAKDGKPYVVPLYFAYADIHLYAFSMPGKKIDFMRANPHVSLVVERGGHGRDWQSVVVDGRFEELPDRIGHKKERDHAWSLLSRHFDWWEPGALKPVTPPQLGHSEHVFFRILVEQLSGREAKEN